jgi:hypothetical protein
MFLERPLKRENPTFGPRIGSDLLPADMSYSYKQWVTHNEDDIFTLLSTISYNILCVRSLRGLENVSCAAYKSVDGRRPALLTPKIWKVPGGCGMFCIIINTRKYWGFASLISCRYPVLAVFFTHLAYSHLTHQNLLSHPPPQLLNSLFFCIFREIVCVPFLHVYCA